MKKGMLIFLFSLLLPIFINAQTCDNSKVIVKSIELNNKNGSAEEINDASIVDGKIKLDVKLYEVNDSVEYNIKIKNESSENITIDKNSLINSSNYVKYTFTSDTIRPNEEKIVKLKVEYNNKVPSVNLEGNTFNDDNTVTVNLINKVDDIVNPKTGNMTLLYIIMLIDVCLIVYIVSNKNISFKQLSIIIVSILIIPTIINASCTYNLEVDSKIQISEKEAIFDIGENVNVKIKQLAGDDTSSEEYRTVNTNIKAIKKSNTEPSESNKTSEHIVSTEYSYYPIYMWFDTDTLYWWSEDSTPSLNSRALRMFALLTELVDISGLEFFNTSRATDISVMFSGSSSNPSKLTNLQPLRNWDVSNVTDMHSLFQANIKLESLDGLENWDVSNVIYMGHLFSITGSNRMLLSDISELSNWNVSKVEDMDQLFNKCSLEDLTPLKNWNVSNVKNMHRVFAGNSNIIDLSPISNWDVSNVETMESLFYNDSSLTSLNAIEGWNVSKVKNFDYTFSNTKITDLTALSNWNTSNATTMGSMFRNCTSITSLHGLENWDVSNVMNFSEGYDQDNSQSEGAFQGMTSLTDASAINDWNINRNAYFNYMFKGTPVHPEFSKVSGTWDSNNSFVPEL